MRKNKILVIDDEPHVVKVLEKILTRSGYDCITAPDGATGLNKALSDPPDLIILDRSLPEENGLVVASRIRKKPMLSQIPILMLTSSCSEEEKISALESYVDDYYCKPFSAPELLAKIKAIIRHSARILDCNPTTNLPGGNALEEEVNRRIGGQEVFTLMHIDIDNFKSYADVYGFNQANKMIRLCGQLISDQVEALADPATFLAHIGGDDFIVVTRIDSSRALAEKLTSSFDSLVEQCFSEDDVSRGFFKGADRKGECNDYPITTISIGIISNEHKSYKDASAMGKTLVKAKNRAKQGASPAKQKSTYAYLDG